MSRVSMAVMCCCSTPMNPKGIFEFIDEVGGRGYEWHCPECDHTVCIRLELKDDEVFPHQLER